MVGPSGVFNFLMRSLFLSKKKKKRDRIWYAPHSNCSHLEFWFQVYDLLSISFFLMEVIS